MFSGSHTQKIGEEEGTGKRAEKIVGTALKGRGKGRSKWGGRGYREEGRKNSGHSPKRPGKEERSKWGGRGYRKEGRKIVGTVLKGQGKRGVLSLEERAEAIIFLAKSRKRKLLKIFKFVRNLMTGSDKKMKSLMSLHKSRE